MDKITQEEFENWQNFLPIGHPMFCVISEVVAGEYVNERTQFVFEAFAAGFEAGLRGGAPE